MKAKPKRHPVSDLLMLDLGTGNGKRKPPGYIGVDKVAGEGVDVVFDLGGRTPITGGYVYRAWPWADNSVEEAQSIHLVNQLTADERVHFANELFRVLRPGGKATIYTPYWASGTAYGNLCNQWPPVSEHWYTYLNREWREANDLNGMAYTCDFDHTIGYGLHAHLAARSMEYQQHAVTFWKEAAQDMVATLIKRG